MELTDREKAIRAAAIIDTDGSISINKYNIRCEVGMTHSGMVDWLQSVWGGSVRVHTKQAADGYKRKPQYRWAINSRMAETFLRDILPFLLLKQGQAHCALQLRSLQNYSNRHTPKEEKRAMWQPYVDQMRKLNE